MMRFAVQLLLLGTVLPACTEHGRGQRAPIVRDSLGVQILEISAEASARPYVVLAIDEAWNPAPDLEFGSLVDVDLAPDGRVVVLDGLSARVTILGLDGEATAFGRAGQGPGEFDPTGLSALLVMDSTVMVPDRSRYRATEFLLTGEPLGTYATWSSAVWPLDWRRHPAGGVAYRSMAVPNPDVILRVGEQGVDTLHTFAQQEMPPRRLGPRPLWDLTSAGGLVVGRSDRFEVEVRDPRGQVQTIVRSSTPTVPITEEDRSHLEELLVNELEREVGPIGPDERAYLLSQITFADRAPVLTDIRVAADGALWVRYAKPITAMGIGAHHIGTAEGWGGPEWEVFDAVGNPKGRVRLPDDFTPKRFMGAWIYGILEDSLGLQKLARVSIDW